MLLALHRYPTRSHSPSITGTPAPLAAAPTARAVSFIVKVCGWRPGEGGAPHAGAGVRKPPREETAGGVARRRVRRYGDFGADGLLPESIERLFGKRSSRRRTKWLDCDRQKLHRAMEIERQEGQPRRRKAEPDHCQARAGEAEGPHCGVAAN